MARPRTLLGDIHGQWIPLAAAFVLCAVIAAAADQSIPPAASTAARESLALCDAADTAAARDRVAILSRGLQRAEEALSNDSRDAAAHFAVACNLGKRTQLRRPALGFIGILKDVARVRREIDDTLVLAPTYAAAIAAKGQMLTELPHCLGGDMEEGRRLLRLAVTLAPDDSRMRSMLADSLESAAER
jgi:hypothetical protein